MNVKTVAKRIRRGELYYLLGRFKTVRSSYSKLRRLRGVVGRVPPTESAELPTLFPDADVDHVVRTIQEEAVFVGLRLPAHIVSEIEAFGRSEPLHGRADPDDPTFSYANVVRGQSADGRAVAVGGVRDPSRCPAIRAVSQDPMLRAVVRKYLGYQPARVKTILSWSFASDFSDEERRRLKHGVIDYHYDVEGFNFVYASFYILDTDRHSGAHVMMKRSHNRKPLRMLLGSVVASEAAVRRQFGSHNEIMIEGPAGTGFIQDPSCFHRATPPTRRDRLILTLRFI
jgi:hypothetical protein